MSGSQACVCVRVCTVVLSQADTPGLGLALGTVLYLWPHFLRRDLSLGLGLTESIPLDCLPSKPLGSTFLSPPALGLAMCKATGSELGSLQSSFPRFYLPLGSVPLHPPSPQTLICSVLPFSPRMNEICYTSSLTWPIKMC